MRKNSEFNLGQLFQFFCCATDVPAIEMLIVEVKSTVTHLFMLILKRVGDQPFVLVTHFRQTTKGLVSVGMQQLQAAAACIRCYVGVVSLVQPLRAAEPNYRESQ